MCKIIEEMIATFMGIFWLIVLIVGGFAIFG